MVEPLCEVAVPERPEGEYNYGRFHLSHFRWDPMPGVRPGEVVEDFSVRRLDGGELRLSELAGRPVVLEAGSFTCPQFVANVRRMEEMAEQYPEVEFLVLYTREAHPGERVGPHCGWDDKRRLAAALQTVEGDPRTYLVDDLDGRVNQVFGGMPNSVYVLDGSARVVYRALFTWPPRVEEVLAEMRAGTAVPSDGYGFVPALRHFLPVFLRGGWQAVWDFLRAMPGTARFHLRMKSVQRQWRRAAAALRGGELAAD